MTIRSFADMVYQSLSFNQEQPADQLVLKLLDTPWVQRLRDISQTANTRLVYMFSEHSRFGHSLGVAYMAIELCSKLEKRFPEVTEYKSSIAAAAMLHDLGHIAPGSHAAQKTWFPDQPDQHEIGSIKIIKQDSQLSEIISSFGDNCLDKVVDILDESSNLPEWTWQILSGAGWNVDRGNWCIVDSILAGVDYGKYNIPALTDSLTITKDGQLALRENRLDAMLHFTISRYAMYRQIYQHRVLLSADKLATALVKRLRETLGTSEFADQTMENALSAKSYLDLDIKDIFLMREPWWRYHLMQWMQSDDTIVSDLASRIINRNLFKTIRITNQNSELVSKAREISSELGFDPNYYVHTINTYDITSSELKRAMPVLLDNGTITNLNSAEPMFSSLSENTSSFWLTVPAEVKIKLGIER